MREGGRKVSDDRLVELAQDIIEPTLVPGPLDREDLREALCELILRRNATVPPAADQVPTLKAAS